MVHNNPNLNNRVAPNQHRQHNSTNTNNNTQNEIEEHKMRVIRNIQHAFHSTRRLYHVLAKRALTSPVILPRNLQPRRDNKKTKQTVPPPNVTYRCDEQGVSWQTRRNHLSCLWCQINSFRFYKPSDLLHHLKTCHGMLHYQIQSDTEHSSSMVVINVRLLRDTADQADRNANSSRRNRSEPLFHNFMFETTLVDNRKRRLMSSRPSSSLPKSRRTSTASNGHNQDKIENDNDQEPDTKRRRRPVRSCRTSNASLSTSGLNPDHQELQISSSSNPSPSSSSQLLTVSNPNTSSSAAAFENPASSSLSLIPTDSTASIESVGIKGKEEPTVDQPNPPTRVLRRHHRSSKAQQQYHHHQSHQNKVASKRGRHRRKKPCFSDIQSGVKSGRLFHSVEQTTLHLDKFDMHDSDDDDDTERGWRFQLRHDDIGDYVDTIPSEMLLMNLWNQFVGMECDLMSDRGVAPACKQFARKYHATLRRLHIEVSFLRHLSELARIGLIDADDIFECVTELKRLGEKLENDNRNGDETDKNKEPKFIYEQNLLRDHAKHAKHAKHDL